MRIKLKNIALFCHRFGILDRTMAKVLSNVLKHVGSKLMMTTPMLFTNVKLEGKKAKRRDHQNQSIEERNPLQKLYFNGK